MRHTTRHPGIIDLDVDIGADAVDYNAIANQESLSSLETEMRKLEGEVKILDKLEYLKRHKEHLTSANTSTNVHVQNFARLSILSWSARGIWQIPHLCTYFKRKYLTDWFGCWSSIQLFYPFSLYPTLKSGVSKSFLKRPFQLQPMTLPSTRAIVIREHIVKWGVEGPDSGHRIFWLKGPAGVGKSAISQSCAEEFASRKRLAAAFFFSRPNQREDSQRLFTSISYQWASKRKPYAEILKSTIHDDPTIVDKELRHQFHHLFISPLQELVAKHEAIPERVVIIDGLDECAGVEAQQAIVQIVAASIRDHTTPFIWLICSRLEPHLVATFNSPEVSAVTHQEELMVSRAIDNEIAKYLTDELAKIGREHDLPVPWPHERDIGILINLSGGLFIYANTVIRFIGDRDSVGPEEQLRAVVSLATSVAKGSTEHPLSELDLFYLLIMQRIPVKILQTVQWILLATTIPNVHTDVKNSRQLLGLSSSQFDTACRTLHSVMKVEKNKIIFYHASFMDFIQDPQRSRKICIWKDSGLTLRTELTQRLQAVCNDPDIEPYWAYGNVVTGLFSLYSALPWDAAAFVALASINFEKMAMLWVHSGRVVPKSINALFSHIPQEDRSKIMWSCKDRDEDQFTWEVAQMPDDADWDRSYILGHGQHKCFCWYTPESFRLMPYRERPPAEQPIFNKVPRTFMQRIKFWRSPTFRRLVQQSRVLLLGGRT
ncbi:hypothetical protein P691DRAFT_784411 [Macrolepiota fuliginosa MF-IS2]|uniref:NACHT domain-containing protein n=1 Tax=Macrolepiota fuliginosa MF-IS2 TaxID=1400762 RepID=A0A9P5X8H5_9AGAR|nr:hypothetical protein P691DRAFT_784411 [Macrolepiota fuliginosa MF-IS2]